MTGESCYLFSLLCYEFPSGVNKMLSTPDSKVKVAMIATNEELVIATDTYNLVK